MAVAAPCCEEEVKSLVLSRPAALGIVLILANDYHEPQPQKLEYIEGPMKDADSIEQVFTALGTICYTKRNASAAMAMAACKAVANYNYPRTFKWIVVVFSGHGESVEVVWGQDGHRISLQYIVDLFQPGLSPQNGVIPKVFLFDACRGPEVNNSLLVPRGGSDDETIPRGGTLIECIRMPNEGNVVIAYSTLPRKKAYESTEGGLWLQCVLNRLKTQTSSVSDILNDATSDVIKAYQDIPDKIQQPQQVSTLHGNLFFLKEYLENRQLEEMPMEEEQMTCPPLLTLTRSSSTPSDRYTQELNKLRRDKVIKERKYSDLPGNHVSLVITLLDSTTDVEFVSSNYTAQSFSCINEARESVAKAAVEFIISHGHCVPVDVVDIVPSPQRSPSCDIKSRSTASVRSTGPPAVQLKNIVVDQRKHKDLPRYKYEERKTKVGMEYRCTVSHPLLTEVEVIGGWHVSKSEAKQKASKKALECIKDP